MHFQCLSQDLHHPIEFLEFLQLVCLMDIVWALKVQIHNHLLIQ